MEKNIEKNSYRYTANDMESYLSLVQFVAISPLVQTTLYPASKTVIVAYGKENGVLTGVSEYIHDNALNIRVEPIEDEYEDFMNGKALDPASLISCCIDTRKETITNLKTELSETKRLLQEANIDKEKYSQWWMKSDEDLAKLNKQLFAIMTLMQGIIK